LSLDGNPHPDPPPPEGKGDQSQPPHIGVPSPASGGRSGWGLGRTVHGIAEIGFAVRDGQTRLAHLYERHPLRVLFPAGDIPTAVLVTTSGGLVAGDRIEIAVTAAEGAVAHVTASAAEKVYRSTAATTRIHQRIDGTAGSWLEYLPPETILFDQARLHRATRIDLAPSAGFLGGGIIVFGRIAMGERFTTGLLHDGWEIRRGGRLIWGDALHVGEDVAAIMAHPACFAGAEACATLVLAPPDGDPRRFLEPTREVQQRGAAEGLRAGVTAVNGLLVARWLGRAVALRRAYGELACHLRHAAMGLPPRLPQLWHV
jgi:urease accessory protein